MRCTVHEQWGGRGVRGAALDVVVMMIGSGHTQQEVAEHMGITRAVVRRYLHLARAQVRAHSGEQGAREFGDALHRAQHDRVDDARYLCHIIAGDVEEDGICGPRWRRATVGAPGPPPLCDDSGRPVLPRAAVFRPEDLLTYPRGYDS